MIVAVCILSGCEIWYHRPYDTYFQLPDDTQKHTQQDSDFENLTKAKKLNKFFDHATARQQDYQLTLPKGNNALEWYHAILLLDPDNEQAKDGIHQLVAIYIDMAEQLQQTGRFDKAEQLLDRATTIGVDDDAIESARKELSATKQTQAVRFETRIAKEDNIEADLQHFETTQDRHENWLDNL